MIEAVGRDGSSGLFESLWENPYPFRRATLPQKTQLVPTVGHRGIQQFRGYSSVRSRPRVSSSAKVNETEQVETSGTHVQKR